jgi:hypothetical protein
MLPLDECLLCECDCDWDDCGCECDFAWPGVGSDVALVSSLAGIFYAVVSHGGCWWSADGELTTGAKLKENLRFMLGD